MSTEASIQNRTAGRRRRFSYPKLTLTQSRAAWISRALLVLTPLLSFTLVEVLNYNDPWADFSLTQIGLNLVWYYMLEVLCYGLFRRRSSAIKWGLGLAWGFGCASHYLISFRGRTLFPGDFLTLRTAVNVAGNYDYTPDSKQIATFLVMLAVLLLVSLLPREERHPVSWKWVLPVAGACAVYLGVFFGTGMVSALGIEPSMWTTRGNGLALNFSVCLKYMRVEQPEGYSPEQAEQLAAQTAGSASAALAPAGEDIQPVNVIVIMNEAFSDLSVLPGVETNQDAMPFLRALTENTVKGYAYSSVFGGTTANSEYEFLTGNTTAFLPAGTVPYQMYVSDGDPSLVGQMKALGYRCVASHPYRSSGWSRPTVYGNYGFDEVYFERDFQNRTYVRGDASTGYVSDQSNYENLIRMYEEKEAGEKLFLFNVTMQNHSAYNMPWTNLERTVWLTGRMEGRFSTVDQYLSLIYQSDRAFEYLVDYFAQVEEPTVILMFGDHQPQVATNFYTQVLGSSPSTAYAEKKQMVPFALWANYDIPEAEGMELSLNYLSTLLTGTAGLPQTGYQQFLSGLYEVLPVVNTVGIRDSEGNWYGEHEALPESLADRLGEYKSLQYNNVFDKGDRVRDFFALPGAQETESD